MMMIDHDCYIFLVPYWTPNVPHNLIQSRGSYGYSHIKKTCSHLSGENKSSASEYINPDRIVIRVPSRDDPSVCRHHLSVFLVGRVMIVVCRRHVEGEAVVCAVSTPYWRPNSMQGYFVRSGQHGQSHRCV